MYDSSNPFLDDLEAQAKAESTNLLACAALPPAEPLEGTPEGCFCAQCPLSTNGSGGPVPGYGDPDSKLRIVAEAPGKHEVEELRPLVGASGKWLRQQLKKYGYNLDYFRRTNVLMCRPPDGWTLEDYLTKYVRKNKLPNPIACCRARLLQELQGSQAIIALGNAALQSLVNVHISAKKKGDKGKGILTWRGSPLRVVIPEPVLPDDFQKFVPNTMEEDGGNKREPNQCWIMPTLHPAHFLREGPGRAWTHIVEADIAKFLEIYKNDQTTWDESGMHPLSKAAQLISALKRARRSSGVAVDVETTGDHMLETELLCTGFAFGNESWVVMRKDIGCNDWYYGSASAKAAVERALAAMLADPKVPKVFHNCLYDIPVLTRFGYKINGTIYDTMQAHHVMDSEMPHSLAFLSSIATQGRYWKGDIKEDGKFKPASQELFNLYNCRDTAATLRSLRWIVRQPDFRVQKNVYAHQMQMVPIARGMTQRGMLIDQPKLYGFRDLLVKREADCISEMKELLSATDFNERRLTTYATKAYMKRLKGGLSPLDVFKPSGYDILVALVSMGIPITDRTKTGLLATGKDIIALAAPHASKEGRQFIRLLTYNPKKEANDCSIMGYRAAQKLRSTYMDHPAILSDGRIHADWKLHGTVSGRMSSSPNMQNLTKWMRAAFVAAKGYKLVGGDFCVAAGTRVATSIGMPRIEQVKPGQFAVLEDGSTATISRQISRGEKECLQVVTKMGYRLIATPEHKVRILDENGDYVWKEIKDIVDTDAVALQAGRGITDSDLAVKLPTVPFAGNCNQIEATLPITLSVQVATLLGYLIGNGSFTDKGPRVCVCYKDPDVHEYIYAALKTFNVVPTVSEYRGVIESRVFRTQIAEWLRVLGVQKNHVPDCIFSAQPEVVAGFLRGLFESDGSVSADGRISYATIHGDVTNAVQQLLLGLGILSTQKKNTVKAKGVGYCWSINIAGIHQELFMDTVGFLSARKTGVLNELVSRSRKTSSNGNIPNVVERIRKYHREVGLTGYVRLQLNNTLSLGRDVSPRLAEEICALDSILGQKLGLNYTGDNQTYFDRVTSITPVGVRTVYDLEVPGPVTYISDGFVSHNCQLELRIQAHLSGDKVFLASFDHADPHSYNASLIFDKPLTPDFKVLYKKERDLAKRYIYALGYGSTDQGIYDALLPDYPGLSLEQVVVVGKKIKAKYPTWMQWREELLRETRRDGYAASAIIGRRRLFRAGLVPTEILNFPIQSTAADVANLAAIALDKIAPQYGAYLINQCHDALVYEIPEPMAEKWAKVMEEVMPGPYNYLRGDSWDYPVDVAIGSCWSEV